MNEENAAEGGCAPHFLTLAAIAAFFVPASLML